MRLSNRLFLVAAAAVLAADCGGSSYSPSSPSPTPSTSGGPNVTIVSGASSMGSTAYNPNPITISRGGTIKWVNSDSATHTSTANDGTWNSGAIAPGGSYSMTFQSAGSFAYHCTIHPNMIGTVTVQ